MLYFENFVNHWTFSDYTVKPVSHLMDIPTVITLRGIENDQKWIDHRLLQAKVYLYVSFVGFHYHSSTEKTIKTIINNVFKHKDVQSAVIFF